MSRAIVVNPSGETWSRNVSKSPHFPKRVSPRVASTLAYQFCVHQINSNLQLHGGPLPEKGPSLKTNMDGENLTRDLFWSGDRAGGTPDSLKQDKLIALSHLCLVIVSLHLSPMNFGTCSLVCESGEVGLGWEAVNVTRYNSQFHDDVSKLLE
jgi:hypothetical protein